MPPAWIVELASTVGAGTSRRGGGGKGRGGEEERARGQQASNGYFGTLRRLAGIVVDGRATCVWSRRRLSFECSTKLSPLLRPTVRRKVLGQPLFLLSPCISVLFRASRTCCTRQSTIHNIVVKLERDRYEIRTIVLVHTKKKNKKNCIRTK